MIEVRIDRSSRYGLQTSGTSTTCVIGAASGDDAGRDAIAVSA
jgi:hypothetical protein